MDKAPTENAELVQRMVRRTLTVVGGSIAATAIAWALSSAPASAETTCEASQLAPVLGLSGADFPASAALPWTYAHVDITCGHMLPTGDLGVADEPATQPGVTPADWTPAGC